MANRCPQGHRADRGSPQRDGNYSLSRDGQRLQTQPSDAIEILHVPIRSYPQLERKIRQGAEALERNQRVIRRWATPGADLRRAAADRPAAAVLRQPAASAEAIANSSPTAALCTSAWPKPWT